MRISLDWLSVSVRPPKDVDNYKPIDLLECVVNIMYLGDFFKRAVKIGSHRFYADILRIDDISFKLCADDGEAVYRQGILIEMSGNGLAIYCNYLKSIGIEFNSVLRDLRSLVAAGFAVNFPRLDVAMDDIQEHGNRPLLRMDKIYNAWANHLFCSRARGVSHTQLLDFRSSDEGYITSGKLVDNRVKNYVGRTIYFGSRKSAICVRFYDKLVEQLQKGRTVSNNITHWVRCEYEFHNARACAVVSMLIDNEWSDFVNQFARCVLGHLRFIIPDDSNRSRCTTCSWWVRFLNNVIDSDHFVIPRFKPSQVDSTVGWLRKSVFPSLWAYIACFGADELLDEVKNLGRNRLKYRHLQFVSDVSNFRNLTDGHDDYSDLYFILMWSCLSCKLLPDIVAELNSDFITLKNRVKLRRTVKLLPEEVDDLLHLGVCG